MKRLKFVFLAVFILCLASCEKELSLFSTENTTLNQNNSLNLGSGSISDQDEECCSDLPEGHELNANDLRFLNKIYKETNIEISSRTVVKHVPEYGHYTYAIKVPETLPFSFVNIVTITDENRTLLFETVNKYTFTPESANDFYQKDGLFSDFVGSMATTALLQIATKSIDGCKDILYNFFNPNCY